MNPRLLLDNSAWARLSNPAIPEARVLEVAELVESGGIIACLPFRLEAGYSARSARDHADISDELAALPHVHMDEEAEARAIDVQAQLARAGHHRLPPVDLIVAALADLAGAGVLHYDSDYDLILDKTDLRFESEWLVPRGTI